MRSGDARESLLLGNRQLWSLGSVVLIRSIGFGATWPFMAIFFERDLGVPIYLVGLIFGALAVASTFCQIAGGYLTDFSGRKRTMLYGSGAGIIIYMGIIAALYLHGSTELIVVMFVATSVSGGLLFPAATAMVADVTSSREREKGYAIYRIMANFGWAVGPLIGSQIFNSGVIWIFAVVEVTLLIQFALIVTLIRATYPAGGRPAAYRMKRLSDLIVLDRPLMIFSAGTLLLMILTAQFSVTLPLYATLKAGIASNLIGYIFAVNGVVVVVGQFPVTAVVGRMREIDGVIVGILLYMAGYLMVGLSTTLPALMFDMVVITLGENFTTPTISSIVSRIAPSDKIGRYMAFNGMARSAGRAMGPAAGSFFLYLLFSSNLLIWLALEVFGVLSLLIMIAIRQRGLVEREHRETKVQHV